MSYVFFTAHGVESYYTNPSRSQSSPWATPDWARKWHPLDALLAERRTLASENSAALSEQGVEWVPFTRPVRCRPRAALGTGWVGKQIVPNSMRCKVCTWHCHFPLLSLIHI